MLVEWKFLQRFTIKSPKIRNTQAEIIDENSYQEISEKIHLVGDGTEKFKNTLTDENLFFIQILYFHQLKK